MSSALASEAQRAIFLAKILELVDAVLIAVYPFKQRRQAEFQTGVQQNDHVLLNYRKAGKRPYFFFNLAA
jgi:hypothetical protein